MKTNRRDFLKTLGGIAAFTIVPRHVLGNGFIAPSDQLTKGIIGTGGMDYIMMYDLIDAIRNKKPAPMDCYDAAAWSAISGLSEMSIARGGALVDFPDFTRGQWIHRQPQFAL